MIASWRAQEDEPYEHIWKKHQEMEKEQLQFEDQEHTYKIRHGEAIEEHIGERIEEPRIGQPRRRRRASEPIINR